MISIGTELDSRPRHHRLFQACGRPALPPPRSCLLQREDRTKSGVGL